MKPVTFKKVPLAITLLALTVGASALAQSPEDAAKELVEELSEGLTATPLEVEITELVIEKTTTSTSFSKSFLGLVGEELKKNKVDYVRVEYKEINERGLSYKRSDPEENEKVTPVSLNGSYREAENHIYVRLQLLGPDRVRISEAEVPVSKSRISEDYSPPPWH